MRLSRLLALCFLVATITSATTVIPMSLEDITRASTTVVEARALNSHTAWNAEHTLIYTYTRFRVKRALKGQAAEVVTVKQMGGHADGYAQHVSGVRYWADGEEVVLFLHPSEKNDGTLVVTGLMQGNFAVRHLPTGDIEVGNGVPDVTAFDPAHRALSSYRGAKMSIGQLESRVQKAVTQ